MSLKRQTAIDLADVHVDDRFWSPYQQLVMDVVIPYQAEILHDRVPGAEPSHAIENFRLAAGEAEGEYYGMVFQDSDVAKWLEAVAYSLQIREDAALEAQADEVIELIGRAQQDDGYLHTYFIVKEPEMKWRNLQECHELYCAGHMIEAAVAYYEATGKDRLLAITRRFADLICSRFGRGEGQLRGFPGHQEIELALLRLYRVTGEARYLETARYFLDERGTEPNFFAEERKGYETPHFHMNPEDRDYAQNQAPVREQREAVGHSVRAAYMYTAMADLATVQDDPELREACERLWRNIVERRMYVTGGVGSTVDGEAFTFDYDLPPDTVYAETCASIAMAFFARRMLEIEPRGEYADVLETQLYNTVLSGMQLDGKHFFYVNPLEVVPGISGVRRDQRHVVPRRPGWYRCACCPPNVARLLTSLGQYAWGSGDGEVFAHLYLGGEARFEDLDLSIHCESDYLNSGRVRYTMQPGEGAGSVTFALRVPAWCEDWTLTLNGEALDVSPEDGYLRIAREWAAGDVLELKMALLPRRVYANTQVRSYGGQVALLRGPVAYCVEGCDNGEPLSALSLPREAELEAVVSHDEALGDYVAIEADGHRDLLENALYSTTPPERQDVRLRAVPYMLWGNREPGAMRVWIREG